MLAFAVVASLYAVWLPASLGRRIPEGPQRDDFAAVDGDD